MASSKPASSRPKYTKDQLSQYFSMIQLPSKYQFETSSLKSLTLLQQLQLSHVPFENLAIHYSSHHQVSLHSQSLFSKIVTRKAGRGGYCMENNCFFGTVLRSLGYEVVSVGARVHESINESRRDAYMGFSHMVNLIRLENGATYMVDVGFGGDGPIQPLPLDPENVTQGIGEQQMRVIKSDIPDNTDKRQSQWIYQTRYTKGHEWSPIYCFTQLEFLPQDYEIMNYYTSTSRKSWFTQAVVSVKMIRDQEEIIGIISMKDGVFKRRIKGESEVVADCKSENERVEALEKLFHIRLDSDEVEGIQGSVTELKGYM